MLAPPAAFAQAADQTEAAPEKATSKRARKARAAQPVARSLEARHEVCLAFLRRHGYTCDTWVEPTCGADSGYYRPEECQRPRRD